MIAYITGVVVAKMNDSILVENNGIGYQIYCGNPHDFAAQQVTQVFTYQHVREDTNMLFGFKTAKDCEIFKLLITVKGVGPKMGSTIIGISGSERLLAAIESDNLDYLKSLPGIGAKTASQILLDLKGKLVAAENTVPGESLKLTEVMDALGALGFKRNELNGIRKELLAYESDDLNALVKRGLQLLQSKKRGNL